MQVQREVAAPAGRVWEVITDLERSPEVLSGVDAIQRIDDRDGFGVGTRWIETRTMMGRQATEEMEVTAVDPGRAYTVEAASRGVSYRSVLAVEPLGEDRSRLSMSFTAEPQGLLAKVTAATIGKLFEGASRRALAKDLDDIAAAVERRG